MVIEPERTSPDSPGFMPGWDYIATFTAVAPRRRVSKVHMRLVELLRSRADCLGASSLLTGNAGVIVRLLGNRAPAVQSVLAELWQIARRELLNRDAIRTRM
jgi:urease accessory protein UreH